MVRFMARRRFTDDVFDTWLKKSGLEISDILHDVAGERQSEPVRERLDAALLQAGNEALLVEAVTKYLMGSDPEVVASVSSWVSDAKAAAVVAEPEIKPLADPAAPGEEGIDPRAELERAAAPAGDETMALTSSPEPEMRHLPGDKIAALEQLDELEALMESIDSDMDRLRHIKGPVDLGALERKLRRVNVIALGLHGYAGPSGTWQTVQEFRELVESIPDLHATWAASLADFLEELPIHHPLRRKREAAELTREAAIGELRNFATLGGIEEEVPGPFEDAKAWWIWATALSGEQFDHVEDWCSANSLDHLADLIAELWSFSTGAEPSDSEPRKTPLTSMSPSRQQSSLMAAMEAARRQAASGSSAGVPVE